MISTQICISINIKDCPVSRLVFVTCFLSAEYWLEIFLFYISMLVITSYSLHAKKLNILCWNEVLKPRWPLPSCRGLAVASPCLWALLFAQMCWGKACTWSVPCSCSGPTATLPELHPPTSSPWHEGYIFPPALRGTLWCQAEESWLLPSRRAAALALLQSANTLTDVSL